MWFRSFRDYETDKPLIKYQVESDHGIIGCEMHDLNGWGNVIHIPVRKRKKGLLARLLAGNSKGTVHDQHENILEDRESHERS